MRKLTISLLLCMSMLILLLTGCHRDASTNFNNLSRADQEKMMKGDPAKIQEMSKQMAAQQQGKPPQARPHQ